MLQGSWCVCHQRAGQGRKAGQARPGQAKQPHADDEGSAFLSQAGTVQ